MLALRETDGTERALAWAAQQVDPDVRENLISSLTAGLMDSGADAEAVLAYTALGSAPITTDPVFMARVAGSMGRADLARARSWVPTLQAGYGRAVAAVAIAGQIAEKQSAAQALEWLQGCGSQADYDSAYQTLAGAWPADDPAGKFRCAQGISDPVQRSWTKYQVGFEWMRRDEAAAVQALPRGMAAKLTQVMAIAAANREEVAELFPGVDAVLNLNAQFDVPQVELEE